MPFELQVRTSFSAAHKLDGYDGNCRNLHGHNWDVEIFARSDILNSTGIVLDFSIIKKETDRLLAQIDHTVLNEQEVFSGKNPTSENIACWLYNQLSMKLNDGNVKVSRVKIWETGSYAATYSE